MKKAGDAQKVEKLNEEKVFEHYITYHNDRYNQYGNNSRSVWNREESQRLRFEVLSKLFRSKQNFSILDIGCGLADFLSYLHREGYTNIEYTGFDINKLFIAEAKKMHPSANLLCGSYKEILALNKKFDYAIACGIHAFGANQDSIQQYFIDKFSELFPSINVGFGANFLSIYSKQPDSVSIYHDPARVLNLVKQRFEKVSLYHNYLPNDFTVLVEK
jgi:SAM-dependent methyltransferase